MESSKPYRASKRVADSTKAQAETELSNARKAVRDLALKIEQTNSRAKVMKEKQPKNQKRYEQEHEDYRYAQVVKEVEQITREMNKLKLDMTNVLTEKRHAGNIFKALSSKRSTLLSAVERIKKEIEGIDEEHVLVELARIEAVKEQQVIEAQRKEEANRYQKELEEVRKKAKEVDQQNELELEQELQVTLYNVNLLENELARVKAPKGSRPGLLQTLTNELETAKTELANIKTEGFNFMASMDVIRNELKRVREEKSPLQKQDEKRELTVETLNSKILKEKAKLESIKMTTEKANSVASNLSVTVEQLRAETETTKKETELIVNEIEKLKLEIPKTESEIELSEKRLESVMDELKTAKSLESTALENLKNLIDSIVRDRELTSISKSTITITSFEYEYLTGKAGGAEEIADKKVAAAHAWMEALKANEKEIVMKIKTAKKEIRVVSMEVEDDGGDVYGTEPGGRRRTVDASPRRSMYKIGSMTPGRRARSVKLLSPATRQAIKSASFTKKKERESRNLGKLLDENDEMG
ncbi:protein PLASTID MOVEMENT IMPAIRED 2 [Helianthus annuus]|nr:protein PLASTID MOVEMENT IMPAIRED 2 [Helianthus annuus]